MTPEAWVQLALQVPLLVALLVIGPRIIQMHRDDVRRLEGELRLVRKNVHRLANKMAALLVLLAQRFDVELPPDSEDEPTHDL